MTDQTPEEPTNPIVESDAGAGTDGTGSGEASTASGPAEGRRGPASEHASPEPTTATTARNQRKVRTGVVVSDRMDKTVLVRVEQVGRHPVYGKTRRRSSKLSAHDEGNDAHIGDTVRLMETRPLSKTKRWRVVEIVERAK